MSTTGSEFTSLNPEQQAALIAATDAAIAARAKEQEEAELREAERVTAALEAELRDTERVDAARAAIKELQDRIAEIQLAIPTTEPVAVLSVSKEAVAPDVPGSGVPAHIRADIPSIGISSTTTPVPHPVSNFHDLIGVNDFLSEERSEIELEHSSMQIISKSDRLRLSASDKSKL